MSSVSVIDAGRADAAEEIRPEPVQSEKQNLFGTVSFVLLMSLMVFLAWYVKGFSDALSGLLMLVSGQAGSISNSRGDLGSLMTEIFALIPIDAVLCIGIANLLTRVLGKSGENAVSSTLLPKKEEKMFQTVFLIMLLEELFARWLFLGVLPKIPLLSGSVAFYVLLLAGNGLWALVHLGNFKSQEDKDLLRVLPQFVGGIFLSYFYVKYGLIGSLLAHTAFNSAVCTIMKIQRINWVDVSFVAYGLVLVFAAVLLMERPVWEAGQWLHPGSAFKLENWGWSDYVKLDIFFTGAALIVSGLLFLDRPGLDESLIDWIRNRKDGIPESAKLWLLAFTPLILLVVIWAAGWCVKSAGASTPTIALIVAVWLCFSHKARSGSAFARSVFISVPSSFVIVAVVEALGFWAGGAFLAVALLISLPERILHHFDD